MRTFTSALSAMLLVVSAIASAPVSAKEAKPVVPDQLELCGAFVRIAPFCGEALEVDTRQLQALQLIYVPLTPAVGERWSKEHREKRRGIGYTTTDERGQTVQTGRPVIAAVARVVAIPPSNNLDEAMLFQALVKPDASGMLVLLPAEGDFSGWSIYIVSSEGKHAVTLDGQMIKLGGRHRARNNLTLDVTRLPASRVTSTALVTRGDGSGWIEAFEATFVDHKLVHDRDGSIRVYSGLPGTFTPLSEGGTSVVAMYTNCRTAGQRLTERGNLRVDSVSVTAAVATGGLTAIPQVAQNFLALFRKSCR